MATAQSDLLAVQAGSFHVLGPRFAWVPSTGSSLGLSTHHGVFKVADFPGGSTFLTLSTGGSVAGKGQLLFSTTGAWFARFQSAAFANFGGTNNWWQLATSAPTSGQRVIRGRGRLEVFHNL